MQFTETVLEAEVHGANGGSYSLTPPPPKLHPLTAHHLPNHQPLHIVPDVTQRGRIPLRLRTIGRR